jgi:hypothetical protein
MSTHPEPRNRLQKLLDPDNLSLNGIDFVEIASGDQRTLRVHFLNTVPLAGLVTKATITGGETVTSIAVPSIQPGDWATDADNRPLLTLTVAAPGDFSDYTLTLLGSGLDRFYNHVRFSFKALCPSDLDCATSEPVCLSDAGDSPPIDYLAKDFLSFRKALTDFSALRYPEWQERTEADFGMMFLEALCSLADDLSYTQDRIAAEGSLQTATQRRSILRHARLVDYEPRPPTSARVLLQLNVQGNAIPSGLVVMAQGPDGAPIVFETGDGLIDPLTGQLSQTIYPVDPHWNRPIQPYWWDDSERCLPAGATEMWVIGQGRGFAPGQLLLIDTTAKNRADPPLRQLVRLTAVEEDADPLFPGPTGPLPLTHLFWRPEDALRADHDLTRTELAGNLVPATQGRRFSETFAIELERAPATEPTMPLAVTRTAANGRPQYLYTLRHAPLSWLALDDPEALPLPEIVLVEQRLPLPRNWRWRRSLLKAHELERAFTLDPARFAPIASNPDGSPIYDYDGDAGDTVRFGDGVFGDLPDNGAVFQLQYRVGNGKTGNVAADSITQIDPAITAITSVTNPFPASGGEDEEPDERVRRLAPQAFRARQFRAVRVEDYEAEAERLPWVQRAGAAYRWTGSWLTVFTTVDPLGSVELSPGRHRQLIDLLNLRRLAGYEVYAPSPRYVSIDLRLIVCASPDAFQGDVEAAVLAALEPARTPVAPKGFFDPDRFSFGQPLELSALAAAVQAAHGVAGIVSITYRRRGLVPAYIPLPETVKIGPDQILRLDNDPSKPERGSLHILVEGGK